MQPEQHQQLLQCELDWQPEQQQQCQLRAWGRPLILIPFLALVGIR